MKEEKEQISIEENKIEETNLEDTVEVDKKPKTKKVKLTIVIIVGVIVLGLIGFTVFKNKDIIFGRKESKLSANNMFYDITVTAGEYDTKVFTDSSKLSFNYTVSNSVTEVKVEVDTDSKKAKVIKGEGTHKLVEGENIIEIKIQAENTNVATYTLIVYREPTIKPEEKTKEPEKEVEKESLSIDKVLDINKVDMSKELPGSIKKPEKLKELKTSNKMISFDGRDDVSYSYTGNVLKLETSDWDSSQKFEIKNIDKIFYYHENNCSGSITLYMFSNNKLYYIEDITRVVNFKQNEKEYLKEYTNNSYTEIYNMIVHGATCGAYLIPLGKTSSGDYYNLDTNEKVDITSKYNQFDILKSNRELKIDGVTYKIKVAIKEEVEHDLQYAIDENNYLYDISEQRIKKISPKKVKSINLHGENEVVSIEAEDGTFLLENPNGGRYIEY